MTTDKTHNRSLGDQDHVPSGSEFHKTDNATEATSVHCLVAFGLSMKGLLELENLVEAALALISILDHAQEEVKLRVIIDRGILDDI